MEIELPKDLLFKIFVKLPVTQLFQFQFVSKYWYSVINSSEFIQFHLHYTHYQHKSCLQHNVLFKKTLSHPKEVICSLHEDNQQFQEIQTFQFPFKNFSIVGCVNGIVCLTKYYLYNSIHVMLWNPLIRKHFLLPKIDDQLIDGSGTSVKPFSRSSEVYFGFGYDVLSKDFKILSVLDNDHEARVVVYCLGTNSWRMLTSYRIFDPFSHSCNVGQFVYRLVLMCAVDSDWCLTKVVCFDLSAEVFTLIDLPETLLGINVELTSFRDSIGLLNEKVGANFDFWVMREDGVTKSWTRIFSVHLGGRSIEIPNLLVVGFTMNGLMVLVGDGIVLVAPIVENAQVVTYVPPRFRYGFRTKEAWEMESFKESLVLLVGGVDDLPMRP